MKYDYYNELMVSDNFDKVDFVSKGRRGQVLKRIVFTEINRSNIFNLSFGDVEEDGEYGDFIVTDNGDRNKVLATIARVIMHFTSRYPQRSIILRGSTEARNRLYRMAIGLNLEELSRDFCIYSFIGGRLIRFERDMEVSTFYIKRKTAKNRLYETNI